MSHTHCIVCHRPLKNPQSQKIGMGKICASKNSSGQNKQDHDSDTDIVVTYDGGDIWVERLQPDRKTVSDLRTNVQRTIYRHSPTGFNYGYHGSGCADLALNILRMFCKPEEADEHYQEFKREFVATEQGDKLTIKKKDIINFIKSKRKKS